MGIAVQGGVVPFYDFDGLSPKFEYNRDSRTATREGHIDWANIDALVAECLAGAPALPGAYPGVASLYVNSLHIEPLAEEQIPTCGNVIAYNKAKVSITYGKLEYPSENLVSRKWNYSAEFMTLPASSVKWENGDAVENEEVSAAKLIPMIEHSLTRHRCPSIPWAAIKECVGKVNEIALDDDIFVSVAEQTLLYLGASIDWTLSTDGTEVWTLEHRFQERRVTVGASVYGWQHFWRPDQKQWQRLKDDAGNFMYPETQDFPELFEDGP